MTKAKSKRDYLLCIGMFYDWAHIGKAPTEDLLELSYVSATLRGRTLPELLPRLRAPWRVAEYERSVDPYALPGVSLRFAVERARRRATLRRETSVGDYLDANHVMHAPYVDLAFVDKRTFEYVRAEERSRPQLIAPGATASLRFAPDLSAVEAALATARRVRDARRPLRPRTEA